MGFPAESLAKLDQVRAAGERAVRIAVDAGVRLGFGTDLFGETQPAQNREFALRGAAQPPLEVLQLRHGDQRRTSAAPETWGRSNPAAPQTYYQSGNPLADLSVLVEHETNMRLVIRAGEIILERERP